MDPRRELTRFSLWLVELPLRAVQLLSQDLQSLEVERRLCVVTFVAVVAAKYIHLSAWRWYP